MERGGLKKYVDGEVYEGRTESAGAGIAAQYDAEERLLWSRLRSNQMGCAFRKQQALGFYFADFVCLEKKLVIELDGSQHAGSEYDKVRDAELQARGFTVLRFWNNEVRENLEGVLERIAEALG